MEINITFRHTEPSDVLKTHIHERIEKLSKYFIKPIIAHVTLNAEKSEILAEISLAENHNVFNAHERSHDLKMAFDVASHKIESQLKKHKEKVKDHHKKHHRI